MKDINRMQIKALIELSSTVKDADKIITDMVGLKTLKEKLAFLKGMFDEIEIIDKCPNDSNELFYNLWLDSIIQQKYN